MHLCGCWRLRKCVRDLNANDNKVNPNFSCLILSQDALPEFEKKKKRQKQNRSTFQATVDMWLVSITNSDWSVLCAMLSTDYSWVSIKSLSVESKLNLQFPKYGSITPLSMRFNVSDIPKSKLAQRGHTYASTAQRAELENFPRKRTAPFWIKWQLLIFFCLELRS